MDDLRAALRLRWDREEGHRAHVIWVNKMMLLCFAILCGIGCLRCDADEIFKAEIITSKVPVVPQTQKIGGSSLRPLLLMKLEERGKIFDDPSYTSYHIYDPSFPEKGLVRIFRGPGNDQDLRPITPLIDGWALSRINLNQNQEPDGEDKWRWYYYPEGIKGDEVKHPFWIRESKNEWLFGEKNVLGQDRENGVHLVKYHPQSGKIKETKLVFFHTEWISSDKVLGVATIDKKERLVLFNINRFEYCDLGATPPNYKAEGSHFFQLRMKLAGKDGVDGVFTSSWKDDGFLLRFLPKGGKWVEVISGVNIVKTFGGVAPSLPVEYLGGGNFAVSKTTINTVPVPEDWPENQKMFGAAKGVTMLIEGKSGKILKESEPFIYEHNPPLKIPEDWWKDGLKPKVPFWRQKSEETTLFQWKEEIRELSFAKGTKLSLSKEEDYRVSGKGRYAIIYQEWTNKKKDRKASQSLKIIDGKDGRIQKIDIESDFLEVLTEAYWLESEAPSAEVRQK